MSSSQTRETAYRVFATEYDATTLEHTDSDDERAPNYLVTPTGAKVNRLFVVGVLTSVEQVNDGMVRARVADPTGAFVVYAGQYQPDALSFFQQADPPTFVAITGKTNAFTPEGSDEILTSIRPESVNEVESTTRDRWIVTTAERTLDRIAAVGTAIEQEDSDNRRDAMTASGIDTELAAGVELAVTHYGTTPTYLHSLVEVISQALEVVTGDRSEINATTVAPGTDDGLSVATLPTVDHERSTDEPQRADAETVEQTDETSETTTEEAVPEVDVEPTTTESEPTAPSQPEASDELYEFDPEERERIEDEHGLEFESATEIEPADEEAAVEEEPAEQEPTAAESEPDPGAIDRVLFDQMETLDDGRGADRQQLIEAVRSETGAPTETIEEAIDDALLSGRCFEPADNRIKPI